MTEEAAQESVHDEQHTAEEHKHGEGCGHDAIRHWDHYDTH